jgi:hypothetical protein
LIVIVVLAHAVFEAVAYVIEPIEALSIRKLTNSVLIGHYDSDQIGTTREEEWGAKSNPRLVAPAVPSGGTDEQVMLRRCLRNSRLLN